MFPLLLTILISIGSYKLSCEIPTHIAKTFFLKFFEDGYRIDYLKCLEIVKKQGKESQSNILMTILPFVNLFHTYFKTKTAFKRIENDTEFASCLQAMTLEERNEYNALKSNDEKRAFGFLLDTSRVLEQFLAEPSENKTLCIVINNDKLMPLSYTLEEVIELNQALGDYVFYRVGQTDIGKIAIIGIPNDITSWKDPKMDIGKNFNRIQLQNGEEYDFQELSLEEAKDSHYIVYSGIYSEKVKEILEGKVEEIRKRRNQTRMHSNSTPVTYCYEPDLKRVLTKKNR